MIISVGAIPVGIFEWKEFANHKDAIVDLCLREEKPNVIESNIAPKVKTNLWESNFSFLQQHSELKALDTWLNSTTRDFVNAVNKSDYHIAITESWAHVTRPMGQHEPHRHPDSTWSGIFYIDADEPQSGNNIWFNMFKLPERPGLEFFDENFSAEFIPGRLIIFPSIMLHYAKPYLGKDRRILIAFNSVCV